MFQFDRMVRRVYYTQKGGGMQVLLSIIASYLPYTLVTAFTPGPNNIVSLHAVSQKGWKDGKNILLGIFAGFLCVMAICALFCYELGKYVPAAAGVLKYIGAAYIVWLAIHVARSKPEEDANRQVSFWNGFFLQFVNVKIILYAITVYTGYVLPYGASLPLLLLHAACLTAIGAAGMITWAATGGAFQKYLRKHYRPFNIAMALVLIYCAVMLALD
jgi:cysteine/O-acetylserine efflux protein